MRALLSSGMVAIFVLALSLGSGTTASAMQTAGSPSAAPGQTLTVSMPGPPDSLDPVFANTRAANLVFASMCYGLYTTDAKLQIVPQLAASLPKVASNGMSETIAIRPGVRFNDGTPLNAQAVKDQLDRDMTTPGSARVSDLSSVASVSVVNPMTVRIDLKHPDASLAGTFTSRAGVIGSPTQYQKVGAKGFANSPVCVGPFKFQKMIPGTELDLVKAPDFYNASKVKLAGLTWKFIVDSTVAVANLRSGDLDAVDTIAPSDYVTLNHTSGFRAIKVKSVGFQAFSFNIRPSASTPFSKMASLRKAFEESINRNAINKAVWDGLMAVDCNPIPLQSPMYTKIKCTPYDPANARKLVKASGLPTPIPVTMDVPTGTSPVREAQVVQSMANAVGFKVTVAPEDLNSQLVQVRAGKFDTYLEGWSGRVDPNGNLDDLVTTGGSNNFSGLASPKLDSLVQQATGTYNVSKRKAIYAQVVEFLKNERAVLYLYHTTTFVGLSSKVHGVVDYPDGLPRFSYAYISK